MEAAQEIDRPAAQTAIDEDQSVVDATAGWFLAARDRGALVARLAAAEARLAATSFLLIIGIVVAIAVLALSAWGLVAAGIVHGLVEAGMPVGFALASVALVHLLAAAGLAVYAVRVSRNMKFSETRRHFEDAGDPDSA